MIPGSLDLATLQMGYATGEFTPSDIVGEVCDRIERRGSDSVWIHKVPRADALAAAAALEATHGRGAVLPLYGVPFAVKDNIDVAGIPTTAGCPDFSYVAKETAPVVKRLLEAGAILMGKTNMDQFAAGLVGVRSPYGACSSVFDSRYISGGSSAGSAVAVAAGLVSFSLGTDTAGSGRVPAAFNNLVGWKPTRGLVSTRGVVPACRSLDCVSVFSLTCADSQALARIVSQFDTADPFARPLPPPRWRRDGSFRLGIPSLAQRKFFGDPESSGLFDQAIERLRSLGGTMVEIDFSSFCEATDLLYTGPWVAERLAAIEPFFSEHPGSVHPVTAKILSGARRFSAVDVFEGLYRLEALRRRADEQWTKMDVLALPTAATTYTIADVLADPIQLNTNLGHYTNFVNLLDLCGIAVPAGFNSKGLPFGISLLGRAFEDQVLITLAGRYHHALGGQVGATGASVDSLPEPISSPLNPGVDLAVVGAHLIGQPLNHQLTSRQATFVRTARTAWSYRLFALHGTVPPKPGLVQVAHPGSGGIEVEVWNLGNEAFGSFVAAVPPPLAIGTLELEDGSIVKGFVCEPIATVGSLDITEYGGWRNYLSSISAQR
jgi:allophanate hydrolase